MLGIRKLKIGKDEKGIWFRYLNQFKKRTISDLVDDVKYAYRVDHDKSLQKKEMVRLRSMAHKCLKSSGRGYQIICDNNKRVYIFKYYRHSETGRYKFTWTFKSEYQMYRSIVERLLMEPIMFPLHKAPRNPFKRKRSDSCVKL